MMKKTLRLLTTERCDRSCEGCCNKQWDLKQLECFDFDRVNEFDEIVLTGGEPMLFPKKVRYIATQIKKINPNMPIYMYTANVRRQRDVIDLLNVIDGITLTLHENDDIYSFHDLNDVLHHVEHDFSIHNKSFRLNVFDEVTSFTGTVQKSLLNCWEVKNIKWVDDCPLPENEVFMRY